MHVLPVLADGHRRKVELIHRFGNCLQACDGALALPVGEDVGGKDGGRYQGEDHQDQPDHPSDRRSFEEVLNSWRGRNLCRGIKFNNINSVSPTVNGRIFRIALEKGQ